MDLGALVGRYHLAFNDRDFDVWREVFDKDVELLIDGPPFVAWTLLSRMGSAA